MLRRNQGRLAQVSLITLCLLLASCAAPQGQAILDMATLSLQLVAEYADTGIAVTLEDQDTLAIVVAPPSGADWTREQAADDAQAMACFVWARYGRLDQLKKVAITFEFGSEGALASTTGRATYEFIIGELDCSDGGARHPSHQPPQRRAGAL
jgi:hypothetical protein